MTKSIKYNEYLNMLEEGELKDLPIFHSTKAAGGSRISKEGLIISSQCPHFKKNIIFFNYGSPAYCNLRIEPGIFDLAAFHQMSFVFDFKRLKSLRSQVFPFDTGAIYSGFFKSEFITNSSVELFELTINNIKKHLKLNFENNEDYYTGNIKFRKTEVDNLQAFQNFVKEADTKFYKDIKNGNKSPRKIVDRRIYTIELQALIDRLDLKSLIAIVGPINMKGEVTANLKDNNLNVEYLGYLTDNMMGPNISINRVRQVVYTYLDNKGYFR